MISKNGFTKFNRFLGKKNKSQTISKSTSNLSIRTQSQFDTSAPLSSHLEPKPITPLPTATTNAPFEQTFRITVLLPKEQLYVARLGAKTDLGQLLILVCENKQLDPAKYEFRHPADSRQVFSCEQTIGAVGLNEIRLCNKSESYDNFNADEIITLRQTVGRESLSSSELSSRNSKHTLKTASQYSSTNSLNSSDSAGMSISYRGPIASLPEQTTNSYQQKPPVAPTRKKRVAPRPPSHNSMVTNGVVSENSVEFKKPLARKEFHVSSPNLSQCSEMSTLRASEFHKSNVSVDCNGNTRNSQDNNDSSNGHINSNGTPTVEAAIPLSPTLSAGMRPVSMSILNSEIHYEEKEFNGNRDFTINGSVMDLTNNKSMPEPAPRKRIIAASKKKAPAPPPRGMLPIATPRLSPAVIAEVTQSEENSAENLPNGSVVRKFETTNKIVEERIPQNSVKEPLSPDPAFAVTALQNGTQNGHDNRMSTTIKLKSTNQTMEAPHKEPVVLRNGQAQGVQGITTSQPSSPDLIARSLERSPTLTPESPIKLQLESKLSLETSSDDDDHVNVYNLKLGTISKPLTAVENNIVRENNVKSETPKALSIQTETTASPTPVSSPRADSPQWSYTIPAPPKFADNETVVVTYQTTSNCVSPINGSVLSDRDEILTNSSDTHNEVIITSDLEDGYRGGKGQLDSKFSRQELLDSLENENNLNAVEKRESTQTAVKGQSEVTINDFSRMSSQSPTSSLDTNESLKVSEVITELNNIINEHGGVDRVFSQVDSKEEEKTESVKPSGLPNFTIQSYSVKTRPADDQKNKSPDAIISDEENLYIKSSKRPSLTLSNSTAGQIMRSRANITRSDSFHSTRYQNRDEPLDLATSRSTSYISLVTAQQTNLNDRFLDTNRRKSSSELSIGESPSLQSIMVMKSILNSRKNSVSNGTANLETDLKSPDIVDNPCLSAPMEVKNAPVIETMKTVYRRPSLKDFMSISEGNTSPTTTVRKPLEAKNTPQFESKINNHAEWRNPSLIETTISQLENSVNSTTVETKKDTDSIYDCDSSKENSPKNKIISQAKTSMDSVVVANPTAVEPEKIYKYQGPPSINFSTWSERPKDQVTIKTDNDYKFGVGKTVSRSSVDYPIQVGTDVITAAAQVKDQPTFRVPFVRSVEYKKTTSLIQPTVVPIERKTSDDSVQVTINNHPRPVTHAMPNISRKSFVPTVKGFKSIETAQTEPSSDDFQNVVLRPATVVRSKSSVSTNILRLSTNNIQKVPITFNKDPSLQPTQTTPSFFSQTALRKTGLKEKILATNENMDAGVPKPHHQRATDQQNCAKLELKLTTTVTSNQNSNYRNTIATEIPPPPPPVIRSVVTKQNSLGKSACIPDTRDQLLSAIRNFNKTALKRN